MFVMCVFVPCGFLCSLFQLGAASVSQVKLFISKWEICVVLSFLIHQ